MTSNEIIYSIKQRIQVELRGTIPPSIDMMRDIKFERAAEAAFAEARKGIIKQLRDAAIQAGGGIEFGLDEVANMIETM